VARSKTRSRFVGGGAVEVAAKASVSGDVGDDAW